MALQLPQPGQIEREVKLVPLKKVDIKCMLSNGLALLNLDLTYVNPAEDIALEATYEFPLEKTTVLAKLVASIDGKTIVAQVKSKEEAKERYDDAVAAGNAAVMAERESDKTESMTIKLGNL